MTAPAEQHQDQAWDELPAGTGIVRHQPQTPELATPQQIQAYAAAFDDQAFLAGIIGEAMDKWFYEFKIAGKTVEGVSVVGAEEFARLRAEQGFPIRFPPGSIRAEEVTRNGELGIQVTVIARECRSGADGLGMAFYPYMVERERGGETIRVADNFPDRKALSVAKRNAILDLIPAATIIGVLKQRKAIVAVNQKRDDVRMAQIVERTIASAKPIPTRVITSGKKGPEEGDVIADGTGDPKVVGEPDCPKCGGRVWDNRLSKTNPKAPDFKCRDKSCDGAIWPPRGNRANNQGTIPGLDEEPRPAPVAQAQP